MTNTAPSFITWLSAETDLNLSGMYDKVYLLMETDRRLRRILLRPEFQKEMGTAELHYLLGRYAAEWERKAGLKDVSVLAAAVPRRRPLLHLLAGRLDDRHERGGVELRGNRLRLNPSIDVNETTGNNGTITRTVEKGSCTVRLFNLSLAFGSGKMEFFQWTGASSENNPELILDIEKACTPFEYTEFIKLAEKVSPGLILKICHAFC
jgi:hypothetical protein